MKVIYSGPYHGHGGGPDAPYEEELEFTGHAGLSIPSCGWIKFEVSPKLWVRIDISEWGTVDIDGGDDAF